MRRRSRRVQSIKDSSAIDTKTKGDEFNSSDDFLPPTSSKLPQDGPKSAQPTTQTLLVSTISSTGLSPSATDVTSRLNVVTVPAAQVPGIGPQVSPQQRRDATPGVGMTQTQVTTISLATIGVTAVVFLLLWFCLKRRRRATVGPTQPADKLSRDRQYPAYEKRWTLEEGSVHGLPSQQRPSLEARPYLSGQRRLSLDEKSIRQSSIRRPSLQKGQEPFSERRWSIDERSFRDMSPPQRLYRPYEVASSEQRQYSPYEALR